jgi:hypothetical protein
VGIEPPVIKVGEDIPPGSIITGFEYITPLPDETCNRQIADSFKLHLPEAVERRKLTIIAGGPSAAKVDLWSIHGPTLALNSAMRLYQKAGLYPTYFAACDPQVEVAGLIPDYAPENTRYFIASKCHPAVFHKLRHRDVRLWHMRDYPAQDRSRIALCCSVTLTATWLMHRLGYTDFEYWGWDGCFMDGKHHAAVDEDWSHMECLHVNYGGKVEDGAIVGGETFATTRSWVAEAKGAEQFFQLAEYFDITIKINGGGMIEHARRLVMES